MFKRLFGSSTPSSSPSTPPPLPRSSSSGPPPLPGAARAPTAEDILQPFLQFFSTFDKKPYLLMSARSACPTDEILNELQADTGFVLPADFRAFTTGGLCAFHIEARPEIWPPGEPLQIAPAWTFYRGLSVFGLSPAIPPESCLLTNLEEMREVHQIDSLMPFMCLSQSAMRYCFTPEGEIMQWDPSNPEEAEKIDGSFFEVLIHELQALDNRRQRYQAGEHLNPSWANAQG